MKKRTVGILLGMTLAAVSAAGCGTNEATEAANESAEIEQGNGEDAGTESAEEAKEEAGDTEASEETEEDAAEEEEPALKVGVLLPSEDEETWAFDGQELLNRLEEEGYEVELAFAQGDSAQQISQIESMAEDEVAALIIAPVDEYGLTEVLEETAEKDIYVFSYDKLIRDSAEVNYYTTFSGRSVGKLIGEEIVKAQELDKVREAKESRTIEFLMGSTDDMQALFLYNGVMEILQPYLEDGTLVCPSGRTTFEDTGILRWGRERAGKEMSSILSEFYQDTSAPDIICTGFDDAACGAADALEAAGLSFEDENWPMITGSGCEADAVADITTGRIYCSVFMDRRELAEQCVKLVSTRLGGETPDINSYSEYDNGVKIINTYICEAQLITADNYDTLIENGYYQEGETDPEISTVPEEEDDDLPEEDVENKEKIPEDSILSILGDNGSDI